MQLQGKVAVVTGGATGIGAGIVRRLAAEGAAVALDYFSSRDDADAIASDIKSAGGKALIVQADVSQVPDVQRLVSQAVSEFGRLDILVNNAGIEHPVPFENITEQEWDRQIGVDLKGPFFAAQAAWRQFVVQGGGGVIINISSVHEELPMVGNSVYCAAKGGLRMLTRTLASEVAKHNVRMVNIGPGAIATPINATTLDDSQKKAELLKEIPLNRVGMPADIANAVVWLASDQASYVTGTTLFVDGGLMIYAGSL